MRRFQLKRRRKCATGPGLSRLRELFDALGVSPALGRTFSFAEEQPGADQVAVVSYGFWQRRVGGDAAFVGKIIQMNGKKYTVVGIMPRGFDYPVPMELWVPLGLNPAGKTDRAR